MRASLPSAHRPRSSSPARQDLRRRNVRNLVVAVAASLAIHAAWTFYPAVLPETPESSTLQATLTEIPPPPRPAPATAQRPPRKQRPQPASPPPAPAEIPLPEASAAPVPDGAAPAPDPEPAILPATSPEAAPATAAAPPAEAPAPAALAETRRPPPEAEHPGKTLPPRVDLVYRVYYGSLGFYIGEAVYRLEHRENRYRIASVGEARGLAALILRGQGKLESEGVITSAGLQPDQFALERGAGRRREYARFDWESGTLLLEDDKTEPLELPTYDPLAFLWQFYFMPPATGEQTFAIATTKALTRYTFRREGLEKIELPSGPVEAERWFRRSDDGKTDAAVWLAPSMHYVAVKLRFTQTERGTLEAVLAGMRADETMARP